MTFWCEVHDASAPHEKASCWYAVAKMNDRSGWTAGPCRVERKRLVALDDIDVEALREALDNFYPFGIPSIPSWPSVEHEGYESWLVELGVAVLAALEGETDGTG